MTSMSSSVRPSSSMVWRRRVTTPSVAGRKVSVKNAIRTGQLAALLEVRDYCLRELFRAGRPSEILRARLGARQRRLDPPLHAITLLVVAEVVEHVLGREQGS